MFLLDTHVVSELRKPRPDRNVKRWDGGQMALRWCAAGMLEAKKQFRRVNGHLHLKALRTALDEHVKETVTTPRYPATKEVAA